MQRKRKAEKANETESFEVVCWYPRNCWLDGSFLIINDYREQKGARNRIESNGMEWNGIETKANQSNANQ